MKSWLAIRLIKDRVRTALLWALLSGLPVVLEALLLDGVDHGLAEYHAWVKKSDI